MRATEDQTILGTSYIQIHLWDLNKTWQLNLSENVSKHFRYNLLNGKSKLKLLWFVKFLLPLKKNILWVSFNQLYNIYDGLSKLVMLVFLTSFLFWPFFWSFFVNPLQTEPLLVPFLWSLSLLRLYSVCFSDEALFALPAASEPAIHSSAGKFFPPAFSLCVNSAWSSWI